MHAGVFIVADGRQTAGERMVLECGETSCISPAEHLVRHQARTRVENQITRCGTAVVRGEQHTAPKLTGNGARIAIKGEKGLCDSCVSTCT